MKDDKNIYVDLMKHCIGMDRRKPYRRHGRLFYRPYRNYFATGRDHEDWDVIAAAGYAERGEANANGGYTYSLTRAGLDWLGEKLGVHIYDEED